MIYFIELIMILLSVIFVGMLLYAFIKPNALYVNELFIRAHFTHNKVDKLCMEYVRHYKYNTLKTSYVVFYDTDGNRYVCTTYEFPKEITVRMYHTEVQSIVARILGNDKLTVTYAADPKSGKLFLRAE